MAYFWDFQIDEDGWDLTGTATPPEDGNTYYTGTIGYTNNGCIAMRPGPSEGQSVGKMTYDFSPYATGGEISMYYRMEPLTPPSTRTSTIFYGVVFSDDSETGGTVAEYDLSLGDSGWQYFSEEFSNPSVLTIKQITITAQPNGLNDSDYRSYIDDVRFGPPADTGFRLLGLAVDNGNLYATDVYDSTLRLITYDKATLTASGTATFGTCDYIAPDDGTGGLYPLARPGADNELYAYGLDGSANQINYKSGTLDWADISPGTAAWDGNFCAALLPDALGPDDIIAVPYNDDDIQRTMTAGDDWGSAGNAGQEIAGGVRYPTRPDELLLAGAAAGTLFYSPNNGASLNNVGGTALGTINWIEVNR